MEVKGFQLTSYLKKTYLQNSVINRSEPKPETKIKWNLEIEKWENKQDPQPELTLSCVCYLSPTPLKILYKAIWVIGLLLKTKKKYAYISSLNSEKSSSSA